MPDSKPIQTYQPEIISKPPIYAWPPRPLAALKYLVVDLFFPWTFVYILMAFPIWWYLTPELQTMASFNPGWLALLWLRNCVILVLFAGSLHWYLHRKKRQNNDFMLNRQWLSTDSSQFLWKDQVRDNMFWSIASGVTAWTAWEALCYWWYANGRLTATDSLWYFVAMLYLLYFWSTTNFYFVHRLLHYKPIYHYAHQLHHRSVDVGPWSGICMHPLESFAYFSPFVLWLFIPVDPVLIVITGLYQGLNPALSHCGFDYLKLGDKIKFKTGDWYHQLHHQYFDLNYGNTPTPFDKIFGSWHDGSKDSLRAQKQRMRERRRQPS